MRSQEPISMEPAQAGRPRCRERLLVVDDSVLLAEAIASATSGVGYGDVLVAPNIASAFRLMRKRPPTLVLADLAMALDNEFELLQAAGRDVPEARVVLMVDGRHDPQLAVDALMYGVEGLACRDQGIGSLLRVLDLVCTGEMAIPRHLTSLLVKTLRQRPARYNGKVQLSGRQREVLRLLATGATDKDICEQLNISLTTVRSHLTAIFEKTETGNRTAAALWASAYFDEVAS